MENNYNITEKFKKAVKDALADGNLTDEEIEYLYKVAETENINLDDARHYLSLQIKKRKAKINGREWWDIAKEILQGGFKLIGVLLTGLGSILALLEYLDKKKDKKK